MTREEFLEIESVSELSSFCYDYDLEDCFDYIIDGDYLSDRMDDEIRDMVEYRNWRDIRDYLCDVEEGFDWYDFSDGNYYGFLDSDVNFNGLKDYILERGDNLDLWEESEEEEAVEEEPEEQEEEVEDIDVDMILSLNTEFISGIDVEEEICRYIAEDLAEEVEESKEEADETQEFADCGSESDDEELPFFELEQLLA